MKIDISDISKIEGASKEISIKEFLEEQGNVFDDEEVFFSPVCFKGRIWNASSGKLKLEGVLEADYTVSCTRCLDDIDGHMKAEVNEEFVLNTENKDSNINAEAYMWKGNSLSIDKPLLDVLILNFDIKHLCREDCRGLCQKCGRNLNKEKCDCILDSQMEV
jgi:uncharacterized protein